MDPRTKVLLTDGFVAVLGLAQVWLNVDDGVAWPLAVLFAAVTVVAAYAGEHGFVDRLPGSGFGRTVALVVVGGAAILAGGFVFGPDPVTSVLLAALAGLGAGILCYRTYFGVVRPVPAARLERARRRQA
ncbi:hypothetical protein ACFQJ5_04650 [Halomicroarcula sp. GCM10025324]|uniref:hypothetical protein n=1 Tax=Haloarcula TaxID=2237 RepID=UPI0023E81C30|nr:hypothetical protein [Halomicroarcula sp. ZS-22-S1]